MDRRRRDTDPDDPRVTVMVGDDSATINPPERLSFEVAVEADDPLVGSEREYEVTVELSWQTEESEDSDRNPELEVK
ncbi:amphi-Trp domain-containing protein [Haloarcula regularis]|uniref:amphi-Trp domain-containing protein n=1 Tax=Haloarcula regularis TaxID=3033392 RepID=UPI0023E7B8F3|nr:amphi-Trp domain-containing protein [Halomicroarcula sp. SYNS111]